MKKNYSKIASTFVAALALFSGSLMAQTTVFTEDFNRNQNPLAATGGTPTMTWTKVTSSEGSAFTELVGGSNYRLAINNGATSAAASTNNGRTYLHGPLSTFSSPFNTTLSSNTNDIIWTFNIRTGRTDGSGFDASANVYGYAVVLAATNSNFLTADGYVVTLTKRGTPAPANNQVRLEKFTGGLVANANLTTIIGPSFEITSNHYFSVKVVYTPTTNTWKMYARNDGATLADPTGGSTPLTQVGDAVVDNSLTGTAMSSCGFLLNHNSTSYNSGNNKANFDNFKVVVDNSVTTATNPTISKESILVSDGKLIITSGEVYNSLGVKIATVKDAGRNTEISLRTGVYFVNTTKGTTKVFVK